ncbi:MAG: protein kinase [Phycisphaerales bacterium]
MPPPADQTQHVGDDPEHHGDDAAAHPRSTHAPPTTEAGPDGRTEFAATASLDLRPGSGSGPGVRPGSAGPGGPGGSAGSAGAMYRGPHAAWPQVRSGDTVGRCTLIQLIQRGGMGEVWQAARAADGGPVAVKIIARPVDPEATATTGIADDPAGEPPISRPASHAPPREAALVAGIGHPHILDVHDAGVCLARDGRHHPYIVMRLVRGAQSFDAFCREHSIDERLRQLDRLLSAVVAIHRRGVCHFDLKPDNVLVDDERHLVLTDFGVARRDARWATDAIGGTGRYMSPEQLARPMAAGSPADIFAVGRIVEDVLGPATRQGRGAAASSPALDAAIDAVVEACTRPDPADRPTASQLRSAIRRIRHRPGRTMRLHRAWLRHRRRTVAILALVAAVPIAIAAILIVATVHRRMPPLFDWYERAGQAGGRLSGFPGVVDDPAGGFSSVTMIDASMAGSIQVAQALAAERHDLSQALSAASAGSTTKPDAPGPAPGTGPSDSGSTASAPAVHAAPNPALPAPSTRSAPPAPPVAIPDAAEPVSTRPMIGWIIREVVDAGAQTIVVDLFFRDRSPGDAALIDALAYARQRNVRVILATRDWHVDRESLAAVPATQTFAEEVSSLGGTIVRRRGFSSVELELAVRREHPERVVPSITLEALAAHLRGRSESDAARSFFDWSGAGSRELVVRELVLPTDGGPPATTALRPVELTDRFVIGEDRSPAHGLLPGDEVAALAVPLPTTDRWQRSTFDVSMLRRTVGPEPDRLRDRLTDDVVIIGRMADDARVPGTSVPAMAAQAAAIESLITGVHVHEAAWTTLGLGIFGGVIGLTAGGRGRQRRVDAETAALAAATTGAAAAATSRSTPERPTPALPGAMRSTLLTAAIAATVTASIVVPVGILAYALGGVWIYPFPAIGAAVIGALATGLGPSSADVVRRLARDPRLITDLRPHADAAT